MLALSDVELPREWLERSRRVSEANSRTNTPMLGTALLAKATDDRVSALALKSSAAHNAYSARGLATKVLVPKCDAAGIDLRSSGREPLNNQPFFGADRVERDMRVRVRDRADLNYLVECLERADFLRDSDALRAFAAFLRVRLESTPQARRPLATSAVLNLDAVVRLTKEFINSDPEGGKRGQALVAAALDIVYPSVDTARVNDPSRRWPGDIVVTSASPPVLAVEVRQKHVAMTDVSQFVARLSSAGVDRGIVVMLHPAQRRLDDGVLRHDAARHGVILMLVYGVEDLLGAVVLWAQLPVARVLQHFVARMEARLSELLCRQESLEEWASFYDS